jgi:hypothetical protein
MRVLGVEPKMNSGSPQFVLVHIRPSETEEVQDLRKMMRQVDRHRELSPPSVIVTGRKRE